MVNIVACDKIFSIIVEIGMLVVVMCCILSSFGKLMCDMWLNFGLDVFGKIVMYVIKRF